MHRLRDKDSKKSYIESVPIPALQRHLPGINTEVCLLSGADRFPGH